MNHRFNRGFTIIELMLAMTFISILLVAIAMVTIQISNIYNKGVTLREVDQAGRAITADIQRTVGGSEAFNVTPQIVGGPTVPGSRYIISSGKGGRLCVGKYTYAWNLGASLDTPATVYNRYSGADSGTILRFVRVIDPASDLCTNPSLAIARSAATEMLASGDRDLVVHALSIAAGASDLVTGQALYVVSLQIGTKDDSTMQIVGSDYSCRPPTQIQGFENYCAINKFDIIARAGNRQGGE